MEVARKYTANLIEKHLIYLERVEPDRKLKLLVSSVLSVVKNYESK